MKSYINKKLYQLLQGKYWILKVVLCATLLSLFLSFPNFEQIDFNSGRWVAVSKQINDPFALLKTPPSIHLNAASFRFFIPLIAKVLHLNPLGCYILQFIIGILLFYLVLKISLNLLHDKYLASLIVFSVAAISVGRTSFHEIRGIFDGIAIFMILLSMMSSNRFLIFFLIIAAGFTDERAIIASGFVILWHLLIEFHETNKLNARKFKEIFYCRSAYVLYGMVIYLGSRYYLKYIYNFTDVNEQMLLSGNSIFFNQINNSAIGVWSGLEGLWILIVYAIVKYFHENNLIIIAFSVIISIIIFIALSTVDIGRSMCYLLPAVFIAIKVLITTKYAFIEKLIKHSAILCILWPAYYVGGKSTVWWCYPFPLQMIRWIVMLLGYDLNEI